MKRTLPPASLCASPRARGVALALSLAILPGCADRASASSVRPERAPAAASAAVPAPAARPSDTDGASPKAPPPPPKSERRLYAKTRFVWIRAVPDWSSEWIGYLWAGESAELRGGGPVYGKGCGTWYAIEPRGYVCVDEKRATLNAEDAEYLAVSRHPPSYASATPHRYAASRGVERYENLPSPAEQRAREPGLEKHLERIEVARHGGTVDPTLAGIDLSPAAADAVAFARLPWQIQIPRRSFRRDSTIAYFDEYLHEGRTFLLTSDFAWVPKDRVQPYTPATFHGVRLGGGVKLPLAFFREHDQPAYRQESSGKFSKTPETFPRLGWVALTGRKEIRWPYTYLETMRDGLWVRATDAVVPAPSSHTPWGSRVGAADEGAAAPKGRGTWIEASVYGGWLIAYENTTPVLATLVAAGRGGVAVPPQDPTKTSSTPTGRFVVTGKFVTATMDAPDDVTHADVPWVQNFSGPHAIHSAYWHDAWGERVSGGCLNVSPTDGRFLFDFTEPKVPSGWHGVRWDPRLEAATVVLIRP